MICQKCGKNPATIHLKQVINGIGHEEYLCSSCADSGNSFFNKGADLNTDSLLESLFFGGRQTSGGNRVTCPLCGSTSKDIQRSGKAGCAKCYETFRTELKTAAYRIHGGVQHVGKAPGNHREEMERQAKIEELKELQRTAIDIQDFELAASLRDQIKALTDGDSDKKSGKDGN